MKYRAWDKKRKCFIYWDDLAISPVTPMENYGDGMIWQACGPDGRLEECYDSLDDIVFQLFSGMSDKNGKEIYEGDIVKCINWQNDYDREEHESVSEVKFNNGAFYPRYINNECEDGWYSWGIDKIEVIGNIFENKELLEK